MATFPLDLIPLLGKFWAYLVYGVIGFGFGYALEISGFGNSKKLAAQFYFKDLTVLKVMFTAIVVAMVLIFAASGLGLLDYNLVWVNPTYLWPGIVGGLIMGVGFIVGGFCPGTSLVAMVTKKIDGLFFVLGGLFGIFVFGEVVDYFTIFGTRKCSTTCCSTACSASSSAAGSATCCSTSPPNTWRTRSTFSSCGKAA